MSQYTHLNRETDENRRDFLKALGLTGAVAAGSATLEDVGRSVSVGTASEYAGLGQAIESDLVATIDPALLASQQASLAAAANELPAARNRGLPEEAPRGEFAAVANAGRPVYEHLAETGFFQATTEHLPEFEPGNLHAAVETVVGRPGLLDPMAELGLTGGAGVDLLSSVIANAEQLRTHHWVATEEIPREAVEYGEYIPAMTKAVAGGILLWLEDLDQHLWQKGILLTPDIYDAVTWNARSMAAGFQLMTEGAKGLAGGEDGAGDTAAASYSDQELGALLQTGFAVQAIGQQLLVEDGYWITEDMRAPRTEGV